MIKVFSAFLLSLLLNFCVPKPSRKEINLFNKDIVKKMQTSSGKGDSNSGELKLVPNTKDALVIRTDFSNEQEWERVCKLISAPDKEEGFIAYVEFLSDSAFEGVNKNNIQNRLPTDYNHFFIFIVDNYTLTHKEYPILCIDLHDKPGSSFRVIPSEMYSIENNLSISNMDFEEFSESVDSDGIFRGFK